MEPRVSRREKKLHLSYDLSERIHCSRIYPLLAPNGSTVILYGHERGIRVLWRGGSPPKETSDPAILQTNGSSRDPNAIAVDGDEHNDDRQHSNQQTNTSNGYGTEDAEQDPDSAFPAFVADVDLDLGTEVLHMSVPSFSSSAIREIPTLTKSHMIVAVACSDTNVLLLTIPLSPPNSDSRQKFVEDDIELRQLEGDGAIAYDIAIKVMSKDAQRFLFTRNRARTGQNHSDGSVLVAAVATGLDLWNIKLNPDSIGQESLPIMHSTSSGSVVSFHPSAKSGQLLISSRAGTLKIYDALGSRSSTHQAASPHEPNPVILPAREDIGRWIMSYHSPFQASEAGPSVARRKQILSAEWILGGRGILVLLEDGEWGIWDLSGSIQAGKNLEDFALRGFLDSSSTEQVESVKPKKGGSKLAPMTPNTRKAKAENLFTGTPRAPGVASTGGISVTHNNDPSGKSDESLILWYNGNIYSVPSLQAFWQRSTQSGGSFGSLYAPGLTHVSEIELMNENITSISQFAPKFTIRNLGTMNTQRDLLVSAEHRFIISQSLRPAVPSKNLFQQQLVERPATLDQRMLDAGELDITGVDRMLDGLGDGARPRRVGFAS